MTCRFVANIKEQQLSSRDGRRDVIVVCLNRTITPAGDLDTACILFQRERNKNCELCSYVKCVPLRKD